MMDGLQFALINIHVPNLDNDIIISNLSDYINSI